MSIIVIHCLKFDTQSKVTIAFNTFMSSWPIIGKMVRIFYVFDVGATKVDSALRTTSLY